MKQKKYVPYRAEHASRRHVLRDTRMGIIGHILAVITAMIWGTTFVSTKVLLREFSPQETLFFRFLLGYIALWIMKPKVLKVERRHEILFAGAGLSGICLYYLFENIALTYTQASNVSVIVSIAPIFVSISAFFFLKEEKLPKYFLLGFVFAIIGIVLISFSGTDEVEMNLTGDLLCVAGAACWGVYSVLTKKLSDHGYPVIMATRRMFFYGLLFMIPVFVAADSRLGIERFEDPVNVANFLYLGIGACAVCFVTWNYAVEILGAIKTSAYIYAIPVVTIVMSIIILGEKITVMSVAGTLLTLAGLVISEKR